MQHTAYIAVVRLCSLTFAQTLGRNQGEADTKNTRPGTRLESGGRTERHQSPGWHPRRFGYLRRR